MKDRTHLWRWRLMGIWVIFFTAVVFISLRSDRQKTNQLNQDKASIAALSVQSEKLRHTDCSLRQFLLTARETRLNSARKEIGPQRQNDLDAAAGYLQLANNFASLDCDGINPAKHK